MNEVQDAYDRLTKDQQQIVDSIVAVFRVSAPNDLSDEVKQHIIGFVNSSASLAILFMVNAGYVKIGRG